MSNKREFKILIGKTLSCFSIQMLGYKNRFMFIKRLSDTQTSTFYIINTLIIHLFQVHWMLHRTEAAAASCFGSNISNSLASSSFFGLIKTWGETLSVRVLVRVSACVGACKCVWVRARGSARMGVKFHKIYDFE